MNLSVRHLSGISVPLCSLSVDMSELCHTSACELWLKMKAHTHFISHTAFVPTKLILKNTIKLKVHSLDSLTYFGFFFGVTPSAKFALTDCRSVS